MKASRKMILSVLALAISAGIMATVPQTAMATENNRIVDNEDQPGRVWIVDIDKDTAMYAIKMAGRLPVTWQH